MAEREQKVQKFTERACEVLRELSLLPSVTAARVHVAGGARYEVEAWWTQKELERGKKFVSTKSYFVEQKGSVLEKLCATAFQADATRM